MQTVKRYVWQIIFSALFALISVLAGYHIFYLSRPITSLQVVMDTPISLVSVRPEALPSVEVYYLGKQVNEDFTLFQLRVVNNGNQHIKESDYSRPISISFPENYQLLEATLIETKPTKLGVQIDEVNESKAIVSPILLNPKDEFSIRFIVLGASQENILENIEVDARIAGMSKLEIIRAGDQIQRLSILIDFFVNIAAAILAVFSFIVSFGIIRMVSERNTLQKMKVAIKSKLAVKSISSDFVILSAVYGSNETRKDVTEIIRKKLNDGNLTIPVNNKELGGDPIHGIEKVLQVKYKYKGAIRVQNIKEGDTFTFIVF